MKYANHINAVLVLVGAAAVVYAITQTYFDPAAQPHVMIQLAPSDSQPQSPAADRGTPGATPLLGGGVAGVPTQSQRPSRSRTRPSNALRESSPVTPPRGEPRPSFQREGGRNPLVVGSPRQNPSQGSRPRTADDGDNQGAFPLVQPSNPRSPQLTPSTRGRPQQALPGQPPGGAQPPPEKRENTPPPPARSSMPDGSR